MLPQQFGRSKSKADIAIIGYAATLPGAQTHSEIWRVFAEGRSVVSEIPESRWSSVRYFDPSGASAGKSYTRAAGILAAPFAFDSEYFGISPREAQQMDPQQRLLLETTARAFEHAAIDPDILKGPRTGVFVGASSSDHSTLALSNPKSIGPHFMLGNTLSIFSNRLSYQWGFTGPSTTFDTACSSSLVALDAARQSLESNRIDTAIVAGANLLISPVPFIGFSQAQMLSRTGACRAFSKDADGYVRSEGAVVFVLQRSSTARSQKNSVRSYLVGTSVNNDGHTSALPMPSAEKQQALIEDVRDQFGIDPDDLAFVEAHGTGTPVGDPQEANALGAAYGAHRKAPLPIGSAKTNFGHLEPAAGLVGLLKCQLSLENGVIPASLHAEALNPDIDFAGLNLEVLQESRAIPDKQDGWLASVNSFGFGGTNAHAVIRQAKDVTGRVQAGCAKPRALLLTAASQSALKELAETWRALARKDRRSLSDQIASANHRTARHSIRLCVPASNAQQLRSALDRWLSDGDSPGVSSQYALHKQPKIAFVFSGNGTVWNGMARDAYANNATFRKAFSEAADLFAPVDGISLKQLLLDPKLEDYLLHAAVAQPLIFAIQLGLFSALKDQGIVPDATLGHSVGEFAAAVASGRLRAEDAATLIAHRCKVFEVIRGQGSMAALACSTEKALSLIQDMSLPIDLAAENSPRNVTVSGPDRAIQSLLQYARKKRVPGRKLSVDYPYHSRAVDTLLSAFDLAPRFPTQTAQEVDFYSGWQGKRFRDPSFDGQYWISNAREPVSFRKAVGEMVNDGMRVFLELGPKTALRSYLNDCIEETQSKCTVLTSLDQSRSSERTIDSIARSVIASGAAANEVFQLGQRTGYSVPAIPYPFQKTELSFVNAEESPFGAKGNHTLLGDRTSTDQCVWNGSCSLSRLPWLADHKIQGRILLPATAILDLMVEAVRELRETEIVHLADVEFLMPIAIPQNGSIDLRTQIAPSTNMLTLRVKMQSDWTLAARCRICTAVPPPPDPTEIAPTGQINDLYTALASMGLEYGPAFAQAVAMDARDTRCDVELSSSGNREDAIRNRICSSDAVLHGLAAFSADAVGAKIPRRIEEVRAFRRTHVKTARLVLRHSTNDSLKSDVCAFGDDGGPVFRFSGLWLMSVPKPPARQTYWDEVRVPIAPTGHLNISDTIASMRASGTTPPSDVEVARSALAGRMAWDLCFAKQPVSSSTDRRSVAAQWLVEQGLADDSTGTLVETSPCPWPDLDTIFCLIGDSVQGATPELRKALRAATSNASSAPVDGSRTRALAGGLLRGVPLSKTTTIALAGDIDSSVVAEAVADGAFTTLIAQNSSEKDEWRARFASRFPVRIVTCGTPTLASGFDVMCCISALSWIDPQFLSQYWDIAKRSKNLILVDEATDLFSVLTRGFQETCRTKTALEDLPKRVSGLQQARLESDPTQLVQFRVLTEPEQKEKTPQTHPAQALREQLHALGKTDDDVIQLRTGVEAEYALTLFQSLAEKPENNRTWLVSQDCKTYEELCGWRRTYSNETGRDLRLIATDRSGLGALDVQTLVDSSETEILIEQGVATAPRLRQARESVTNAPDTRRKLVLKNDGSGSSLNLNWVRADRQAPGPKEVEIKIAYAGLNFRDIMVARRILTDDSFERGFAGPNLGIECSGTVVSVGKGSKFKVGTRVAAFARSGFASHVTLPETCIIALSDDVSFEEGATLPVSFLTADYALRDCARLKKGDSVLIHSATGGLGLACLQIAKMIGLTVFATAGSPEKRRYLKALGVEHVYDSRSLTFADGVMRDTEGLGVDAVINSLSGEHLLRGLDCLSPFGRFIELGKRDILSNAQVGLRVLRNNISFIAVDADQLLVNRPRLARAVLKRLEKSFLKGDLWPLSYQTHPSHSVEDAFNQMQSSEHIGKILVEAPVVSEKQTSRPAVPIDGTWLIVGGTRGFGLETAKWVARKGAKRLHLASKSGTISPKDFLELSALGVDVHPHVLDVTNELEVTELISNITANGTLEGVVHAAMLLDDALIKDLTPVLVRKIFDTKVLGAQNLDQATRDLNLNHFWLYSSLAARLGNPGQAPYVGANFSLERLASDRRKQGLPALAVAWGPISDAGFLTEKSKLKESLEHQGADLLSSAEALALFDEVLNSGANSATITIARAQWEKIAAQLPSVQGTFLEQIAQQTSKTSTAAVQISDLISEFGKEAAQAKVITLLRAEIAVLLKTSEERIDPKRPLSDFGFDSLLAVQFNMTAEEKLGVSLSPSMFGSDMTLAQLVAKIFDHESDPHPFSTIQQLSNEHLEDGEAKERLVKQFLQKSGKSA